MTFPLTIQAKNPGETLEIMVGGIPAEESQNTVTITVASDGQFAIATADGSPAGQGETIKIRGNMDGILKIASWMRKSYNGNVDDNEFRGALEIRTHNDQAIVINEIAIGYYLRGFPEAVDDDNPEKKKALTVAARSYAAFHLENEKYAGAPYHGTDGEGFQTYLGYGYESRAPEQTKIVEATKNEVLVCPCDLENSDKIMKAPYSESDYDETVPGDEESPCLVSVIDDWCDGSELEIDTFSEGEDGPHGIGLPTPPGALCMAEKGYKYYEILKYYYSGAVVEAWQ